VPSATAYQCRRVGISNIDFPGHKDICLLSSRIALDPSDLILFPGTISFLRIQQNHGRLESRGTEFLRTAAMRLSPAKKLFAIHESTKRLLCRCVWVVAALMPLLGVVIASIVITTPWYQSWQRGAWETRISENLGVTVRTKVFKLTAPHQFYAEGVELRHPETDVILARIARLNGLMRDKGWSILLETPELDAGQLESGLQVLHDAFLCRPQKSSHLLAIGIPKGLTLHSPSGVSEIERMEILLRPAERASTLQAKMTLKDQPFGEVAIQVSRDHNPETTATSVTLSSTKSWLPCDVLSERFTVLKNLGRESRFRGELQCNVLSQQWDVSLQGEFDRVDWGAMSASVGSPVRSSGMLSLAQLNLRDGKILRAIGQARCEGGVASKSWLQRTSQLLQLPAQFSTTSTESIAIDTIDFGFNLDSTGLRLAGALPGPSNWPPVAAKLQDSTICTPVAPENLASLNAIVTALRATPLSDSPSLPSVDFNTVYLTSVLPWPNLAPTISPAPMRSRISKSLEQRQLR